MHIIVSRFPTIPTASVIAAQPTVIVKQVFVVQVTAKALAMHKMNAQAANRAICWATPPLESSTVAVVPTQPPMPTSANLVLPTVLGPV